MSSGQVQPLNAKISPLVTGPSQGLTLSPFSHAEESRPSRKIFLNGVAIDSVSEIVINTHAFGGTTIQLTLNPKDVKITEDGMFIDVGGGNKKYSKKQLRDLIVKNLDNMEAIKWINHLGLSNRGRNKRG